MARVKLQPQKHEHVLEQHGVSLLNAALSVSDNGLDAAAGLSLVDGAGVHEPRVDRLRGSHRWVRLAGDLERLHRAV